MASSGSGEDKKAISHSVKKRKLGCFLVVFFSIFFVAGCVFFYFFFIRPVTNTLRARDWEKTPCTILSSRITVNRDDDGTTYGVKIQYRYTYRGATYNSDRYDFWNISTSNRQAKQRIVDRYPPGSQAECYVDPGDPTQAVIDREFSAKLLFGFLPMIFIVVGAVGLFFGWRKLRKERQAEASPYRDVGYAPRETSYSTPETTIRRGEEVWQTPQGPRTLKPKSSPWINLLVIIGIALFWNGVVSVFLWQVIEGFRAGKPNWFITIFIIPFVLVGLGLIFGVLYTFLTVFNPRPTLTVDRSDVPLGGEFQLGWRFTGQTGSIRELTITLRGQEEATYVRGTNTYTDTEAFAEIPICQTTNFIDMANGQKQVQVPVDTMHSWQANFNKVVWHIVVHGDIARWPDVNEVFPIEITPREESSLR